MAVQVRVYTSTQTDALLSEKYTKPSGGIPATDLATGVIPEKAAPVFDDEASYEVCDFVYYSGKYYQCKKASSGGILPTNTEYWTDMTYLSTWFSSDNTSLNTAIDTEIAARCANLDPNTSSIADIINALKGN